MSKQYILATSGEELTGEKFQKYLMSFHDDGSYSGVVTAKYMAYDTAMIFKDLDEALHMVKLLILKEHWGWYPLEANRSNEGGI